MPVPPLTRLLSRPCLHVVVDMQRLFAEPTVWHTPALTDILLRVVRLTRQAPEYTVFLRFIPPERPDHASGAWRTYYERWRSVTLAETGPGHLELVDSLRAFVPPARVCDKTTHSAFNSGDFRDVAGRNGAEVLVLSGVETDVCVLGTAQDAIDAGFYVVMVSDAVASSVPESHRATLESLVPRFDEHAVVATTEQVLAAWRCSIPIRRPSGASTRSTGTGISNRGEPRVRWPRCATTWRRCPSTAWPSASRRTPIRRLRGRGARSIRHPGTSPAHRPLRRRCTPAATTGHSTRFGTSSAGTPSSTR